MRPIYRHGVLEQKKAELVDKDLKCFTWVSLFLMAVFLMVFGCFHWIYRYSSIRMYHDITLVFMLLTIVVMLSLMVSMTAIFYIYRRKRVPKAFLRPVRSGLRLLLPLGDLISGVLGMDRDTLRKFYINMNNIMVESRDKRFRPDEIMVILPHCLQNSACELKITNDIDNCRRCGRCSIGEIADFAKGKGVKVSVVTGGTAARNVVRKNKPGMLLSVACERDLAGGIADVGNIPVIGIVNQRPNGPCQNTAVDLERFHEKLERLIEQ